MQHGAEVKVGLIALLGTALLAVFAFYIMGLRASSATYPVCVMFANAQSIQPGSPVMMSGVKIGEVKHVELNPGDLRAKLTLSIGKETTLYDSYKFVIASSGLIQQVFVDVIPPEYPLNQQEGAQLKYGQCVEGAIQPSLSDIIAGGQELLTNINRTASALRTTVSDQEVMNNLKSALTNIAAASAAAAKAADSAATIMEGARPEVLAALANANSASRDIQAMAKQLRTRLASGESLDNVDEILRQTARTTANVESITRDISKLTGDQQVQGDLRGTLADIRQTTQKLTQIADDIKVVSGEARKAAPAIPRVIGEVEAVTGQVASIQQRLTPKVDASFDVLYGPHASHTFSSGRVDISTDPVRFFRVGIDDIGEESSADVQIGDRRGKRATRYGLVRSRLGAGIDVPIRRGSFSVNVFDPNRLRLDALLQYPISRTRSDLMLLTGVRDLGDDPTFVIGARLAR
jgi:phospholipid/cholesterol/gamma-HCH transport system substrate-binding protein